MDLSQRLAQLERIEKKMQPFKDGQKTFLQQLEQSVLPNEKTNLKK